MLEKIIDYYFENYTEIKSEDVEKYLKKSLRMVKSLLYNRLTDNEYLNNCSESEIEKINNIVCEIAEFYYKNEDKLNMLYKNYSLGDLNFTVELNHMAAVEYNGVVIPALTFLDLKSLRHFTRSVFWGGCY